MRPAAGNPSVPTARDACASTRTVRPYVRTSGSAARLPRPAGRPRRGRPCRSRQPLRLSAAAADWRLLLFPAAPCLVFAAAGGQAVGVVAAVAVTVPVVGGVAGDLAQVPAHCCQQ